MPRRCSKKSYVAMSWGHAGTPIMLLISSPAHPIRGNRRSRVRALSGADGAALPSAARCAGGAVSAREKSAGKQRALLPGTARGCNRFPPGARCLPFFTVALAACQP